jgi:hypothetical protein
MPPRLSALCVLLLVVVVLVVDCIRVELPQVLPAVL